MQHPLRLLTHLAALAPSVLSIPIISSPAQGASVPATGLTVQWADNGDTPTLAQLSSYTLTLYVGGNEIGSNAQSIGTVGTSSADPLKGGTASGTIGTTTSFSYTNGFYLQMIATLKGGGTVTTYSDRFTVTGLTGQKSAALQSAITAAGATVPANVNGAVPAANAPAAAPAATVPANGAGVYNVPYNEQTGLTKYAPMQGIPPTKISLKTVSMQYPTSAYTVAKTYMPRASIVTTITEEQTFSVKSSVNMAKTQSMPTPDSDMQKFLARWKD